MFLQIQHFSLLTKPKMMLRSACIVATLACVLAGDVNEDLSQKVLDNSVKFVAAERKDMKEMGRLVSTPENMAQRCAGRRQGCVRPNSSRISPVYPVILRQPIYVETTHAALCRVPRQWL